MTDFYLKKAEEEADFIEALNIERRICASDPAFPPCHIGGLIFERYLCGAGEREFFEYGYLIITNGKIAGYATCYLAENEFDIAVLPEYQKYFNRIIPLIDGLFNGAEHSTVVNSENRYLISALDSYNNMGESRFQTMLSLNEYSYKNVQPENVTIRLLREEDVAKRAEYGFIPTGRQLSLEQYSKLMKSTYYQYVLDYVVIDNTSGRLAAYFSFWIDKESKSVLLEPVACLPEFRRRGIMKRALFFVLDELKRNDYSKVYVSTSEKNVAAQGLYTFVGFRKIGVANLYTKEKNS